MFTTNGDSLASLAANASGQVCVASQAYVFKVNADGTQAYLNPLSSIPGLSLNTSLSALGVVNIALAMDSSGNCYFTSNGAVTATTGAYQAAPKSGSTGMFVVKLDTSGNVSWATYLGGSGQDLASAITLDPSGNVWLTGATASNDFPTLNGLQTSFQGGTSDAFVAELNSQGSALLFGTYLGGSAGDSAAGITSDSNGNTYVAGSTASSNFPVLNPLSPSGTTGAFVTKFSNQGQLLYSSAISGTGSAAGVAVDSQGDMWLAGVGSPTLVNPLPNQTSNNFVMKLDAAGSAIEFATLYGEDVYIGITGVRVDNQDNAYIGGDCQVGDRITLLNPIESDPGNSFFAGFDPNGNLLFSTYAGGESVVDNSFSPNFPSFNVDSSQNIYTAGSIVVYEQAPMINSIYGTFVVGWQSQCDDACRPLQPLVSKIGLGTTAALSIPGTVEMPTEIVGNSSPQTAIDVWNASNTTINISSIAISGDYSQTNNCPAALTGGSKCTFEIVFTPTAAGTRTGAITFTDDAPGSPQAVQLTGVGQAPAASLSPTSLTFPSQAVGTTSAPQTVSLSNTGTAAMQISSVTTSGDFAESNSCGLSLGNGATCTINVTFTPTAAGTRTGTLTITDNAPGSPHTVSLSGTGVNPSLGLGVVSGSSTSQTVNAGSTATYNLSIGGQGVSGTATFTCSGAPTGATCTPPSSQSVSATSTATFKVSVTTTARTSAALNSGSSPLGWMWAMGLIGMVLVPALADKRRASAVLATLAVAMLLGVTACGGGSYSTTTPTSSGTPSGTYTLTITAASGSNTQSLPVTLVVQ